MDSDLPAADAALLHALRCTWQTVDPLPLDLVDRMVAAVASEDLAREYALLTLVTADAAASVRGDAEMLTLQFSDGTTNVLVHVSAAGRDTHRIDGWVDGPATEVALLQDGREAASVAVDAGRFAFDEIAGGLIRLRIALEADPSGERAAELLTPGFEL